MYLIELLLPLADNNGSTFSDEILRGIQAELSDKFGGLTAHTRAPARGIWATGGKQHRDDIVIVEVMTPWLDEAWWAAFRRRLETLLKQEEVIIRAQEMQRL